MTGKEAKKHLRKILEIIVTYDYPENLMYLIRNYIAYHNLVKSDKEISEFQMREIEDHISRMYPEEKAEINI